MGLIGRRCTAAMPSRPVLIGRGLVPTPYKTTQAPTLVRTLVPMRTRNEHTAQHPAMFASTKQFPTNNPHPQQHLGDGLWTRVRVTPLCLCVVLGVCVASVRPISTGRLGIAAVHLRPINPIVCWGPYTLKGWGNLILKRASRLDAFSGYHFRT